MPRFVHDDGVVWIAPPNLASYGHARFGRAWRGLEPPRHLVVFTPSALFRALERAELRLVSLQRPASGAWVYDASEALSASGRSSRRSARIAVAWADARSAVRPDRGEELVAPARPA